MEKMCKVVMLPTNEKEVTQINKTNQDLLYGSPDYIGEFQYLYIISEEKVKEGDWFLVELFKIDSSSDGFHIEKCYKISESNLFVNPDDILSTRHIDNCHKIIASTDKSLKLPLIPEGFIKKYVELQGDIREIMVEYENITMFSGSEDQNQQIREGIFPKVRKDNTIIIHKFKEFFTIEEVQQIAKDFTIFICNEIEEGKRSFGIYTGWYKWIKNYNFGRIDEFHSLREEALQWWFLIPQCQRKFLIGKYISEEREVYSLTGREIEEIYRKENEI